MTTLDIEAAKARQEEIRAERERLDRESVDLMHRIQREDDRPLVGRCFRRNCISHFMHDGSDDGWRVWTYVTHFDDESGAFGIEYRWAGDDWYDVKMREHVNRDEVGEEITPAEFRAAIQPLLDRITHPALYPPPPARPAGESGG